jgi:hypothetical protein
LAVRWRQWLTANIQIIRKMKLVFKILLTAFIAFSLASCIDELGVDTKEGKRILVVEGAITTLPGPHRIILSKSDKYGSVFDGFIRKETRATVWIRDNDGDQVFLSEGEQGNYYTPASFSAKAGNKYTLHITLDNGERYISLPEEVVPSPPIDSLSILFKEQPSLDFNRNTGIEVYVRWNDPKDTDNFYLWEAEGVYVVNTKPHLFEGKDENNVPVPMPKSCCDRCYVYDFSLNTVLRVFKDNLTDGNNNAQLAAFIPDDGRRFMEKYLVVVQQSSLNKSAYQFYDLLKNQLSIQGNIFDPPPATIRGNMINLDDPDSDVIGYFRASDVQIDTLYITRAEVEEPRPIDQINDDCRVLENSSTQKPSFWK